MNLLLDTHAWIWWINQESKLSAETARLIEEAEAVAVSSISCWEVRMLQQRRRIELADSVESWLEQALKPAGIECFPITCAIADKSANLPQHHRDPADRMIIATALEYCFHLVSIDEKFEMYSELEGLIVSK